MSEARLKSVERIEERRRKPRICVPFHAKVKGVNDSGEAFTIDTVLDNVSGEGLYMRMMRSVKRGTRLSIVVELHTPPKVKGDAPRFVIGGVVQRTDEKAGGVYGVAVCFEHVRFA